MVISPYDLHMKDNAWFVWAYCEQYNNVAHFKLNRIISYQNTSCKYYSHSKVRHNEHDYLDENGLKGDSDIDWMTGKPAEWYHIKLELHGKPAMYVKEYIYGKNQTVTAVDRDTTILECDMHYKYNTIQFAFSFGADCRILEPKWLQDEVRAIAREMSK